MLQEIRSLENIIAAFIFARKFYRQALLFPRKYDNLDFSGHFSNAGQLSQVSYLQANTGSTVHTILVCRPIRKIRLGTSSREIMQGGVK